MDDIELLVREARPDSGRRDRPLSERAERDLAAIVGTGEPDSRHDDADHVRPASRRAPRRDRPGTRPAAAGGSGGRPTRIRRRLIPTALAACAVVAIAIGIGGALDDGPDGPGELTTVAGTTSQDPSAPDPAAVLRAAAELLDGRVDATGESAPDVGGDEAAPDVRDEQSETQSEAESNDASSVLPQAGDGAALVDLLTSGTATPVEQAGLLEALAADGRASSAERSTDPDGDPLWRVFVDEIVLVIRADTGAIVAVVDADGLEHEVPPTR